VCWGMAWISVAREDTEQVCSAFPDKVTNGPLKIHQRGEGLDWANEIRRVVTKLGPYLGRINQLGETSRQG